MEILSVDSKWSPRKGVYFSKIILTYDDWNDYSYRTSFGMYYCDQNGDVKEIGQIKIYCYENDEVRTNNYSKHTKDSMPNSISQLSSNFCSLGQDLLYYKNLKDTLPDDYSDILKRLNDIATNEDIKIKFIDEKGVRTSLLRFSGAEKALEEAQSIIFDKRQYEKDISFSYKVSVPYDDSPTELNFDFHKNQSLPYRINVLIGKNGTGKTQILSRLANSLSGYTDSIENGIFVDKRPPIDKVMSISYSAFDAFRKPPIDKRSIYSYVYCGIQSEQGTMPLDKLKENLKNSFAKVKERERQSIWHEILSEIMEEEHRRTVDLIEKEQFHEVNLSSGQQILICTITELIANIENESIILFDEPEIHLHPNAISNVLRMFYKLLDMFNSFAIFSTHSPLILQEIPSKYIQILDRTDNMLSVRKPDIECFGNNINSIIRDVFDVKSNESNYQSILFALSREKSYQEISALFNDELGLSALMFLKSCYNSKE